MDMVTLGITFLLHLRRLNVNDAIPGYEALAELSTFLSQRDQRVQA